MYHSQTITKYFIILKVLPVDKTVCKSIIFKLVYLTVALVNHFHWRSLSRKTFGMKTRRTFASWRENFLSIKVTKNLIQLDIAKKTANQLRWANYCKVQQHQKSEQPSLLVLILLEVKLFEAFLHPHYTCLLNTDT